MCDALDGYHHDQSSVAPNPFAALLFGEAHARGADLRALEWRIVQVLSLVIALLAQVAPAQAAQAVDCAALVGRASVWDRARAPQLQRYCDRLAQAEARIAQEPARADEAAVEADAAWPGHAAPLVMRGRAATALGKYKDAAAFFAQARAIDPSSIEGASSLYAEAVSLRESGDERGSVRAFRTLVPRVSALGSPELRGRALIEAGLTVLSEGPDAASEAVAILRAATLPETYAAKPLALAALSLALDRTGDRAAAQAMAIEAQRTGALLMLARGNSAGDRSLGRREDVVAMVARVQETRDAQAAIVAWESFLSMAGSSPWASYARGRIAELRKGVSAPARKAER